eukprot:9396731-Ditylum_brightwellii.AAC.1
MKINTKSLEFANHSVRNKPPPIPFYMPDSGKKLSPLDYQTYKLRTSLKDEKLAIYNLVVKYYELGTPEEWLQFMEAIVQVIKGPDIQDGDAAYSLVKSLLKGMLYKPSRTTNKVKRLKMAWIPNRVTATKISCKEIVDILEDGILYQCKLEFKKEGFDLSSSALKEFLDMCVHLEEAELQKTLGKKTAHAKRNLITMQKENVKTGPNCITRDVT